MLKLTLIATLTLLPILAILATILLDELGCHGGTANMGQDEVFCMIKGITSAISMRRLDLSRSSPLYLRH